MNPYWQILLNLLQFVPLLIVFFLIFHIPELTIRFNNESVELVDNHIHLGVTFASDGNWTVHIENIATSALKQVKVLVY
jgi:hypothetical protein